MMNSHTHTHRQTQSPSQTQSQNEQSPSHTQTQNSQQSDSQKQYEAQKTPCKDKDKDVDKDIHTESESQSPTVNRSQRATNRDAKKRAIERGKSFLNNLRQGGAEAAEPEEKKPKTRTSFIWKYVVQVTTLDKDGQEVQKNRCSFCGDKFACKGGNTTTTRKHLFDEHFALLDENDIPGLQPELNL